MSDYDYCEKHDTSFLVPEILMCPKCARDRLMLGDVPEPIGDALIEYVKGLEMKVRAKEMFEERQEP